jgi:hypothetical protein
MSGCTGIKGGGEGELVERVYYRGNDEVGRYEDLLKQLLKELKGYIWPRIDNQRDSVYKIMQKNAQ